MRVACMLSRLARYCAQPHRYPRLNKGFLPSGRLRPPDPLHSGGLRPPQTPCDSGGSAPRPPVKCERGHGRGLTTKPAYGSCDSGWPKQWPVTSLVPGGRDSSRPGLGVPIWPAEAATAADLKGGVWGGGAPPPGKKKS